MYKKKKRDLEICSNCQRHNYWKEQFDRLKLDTDRRFKLYDLTIKSLMEKIRKYEPISEEELCM
jgi:hypothetical protein